MVDYKLREVRRKSFSLVCWWYPDTALTVVNVTWGSLHTNVAAIRHCLTELHQHQTLPCLKTYFNYIFPMAILKHTKHIQAWKDCIGVLFLVRIIDADNERTGNGDCSMETDYPFKTRRFISKLNVIYLISNCSSRDRKWYSPVRLYIPRKDEIDLACIQRRPHSACRI